MTTVLPIVTNLSARVIRILGCNPGHMTLQGTNSYLIGTGRKILLDTSEENKSDYVEELRQILKKLDVRLETVLISHWHQDHVGSAGAIHSDKNLHADHGCTFHKMPRREFNDMTEGNYGSPMKSLVDGQKFLTEGATVRAIYTPGHTSDHTAFLLEEENAIFTGDCVLGEGTTVFETLSDYMRSLYLLKDLNANIIYPGHGPHSTSPLEHIGRYITNRESRERQIIECLQQNERLVLQDIVRKIYKELPENLFYAAAQNVNQHLEKLSEEGKVGHNNDAEYYMKQSNKL